MWPNLLDSVAVCSQSKFVIPPPHMIANGEVNLLIRYNPKAHDPESEKIDGSGECYPNCDSSVWLRSCEKEIIFPMKGEVRGTIPKWLNGSLLRNGPGNWKVGDMTFKHLFDCSALLHRFGIKNGTVTYQTRFVQTDTLKKNTAAQRIVVTEFGTASVPDPCHSIFDKVSTIFKPDAGSDNSMITIYPIGDEFYSFAEIPVIHRINPSTLATEARVSLCDYVGIVSHTSHPHVMPDSTVYNLGISATRSGPAYNIICFPKGQSMFEEAHVVGTVPCRWKLHPGYMHTFGITENFFIIVEQPLSISLTEIVKAQMSNTNLSACLKWFDHKPTFIYLLSRKTGKLQHTFQSEAFFYLHIINQYEEKNHVVLDICCYKDPSMINCMYMESMMNMQNNPNYGAMFRGKPLRFVLPLAPVSRAPKGLVKSMSLASLSSRFQPKVTMPYQFKRSESNYEDITSMTDNNNSIPTDGVADQKAVTPNLVKLEDTKAEAIRTADGSIWVRPEMLCTLGCETPRINYDKYLGKKYRYFYAINSDVDVEFPGTLIKVDTKTKTAKTWAEVNCYPSEPIFVPSPNSKDEDDGVILTSMVWGGLDENHVGLLVLCAKTFTELGRCDFRTPSPVPKCLHGWYAPTKL